MKEFWQFLWHSIVQSSFSEIKMKALNRQWLNDRKMSYWFSDMAYFWFPNEMQPKYCCNTNIQKNQFDVKVGYFFFCQHFIRICIFYFRQQCVAYFWLSIFCSWFPTSVRKILYYYLYLLENTQTNFLIQPQFIKR